MPTIVQSILPQTLERHESEVLSDWVREQVSATTFRKDLISERELRERSSEFLQAFRRAFASGSKNIQSSEWTTAREILAQLSKSQAEKGFTLTQTATFVFSLKQSLFTRLRRELESNAVPLADEVWELTVVLDQLGHYTTEIHQKAREDVILRQQNDMLELSTPVLKLWDGILALPMIGTLDSSRTQVVMETLLQRIVETGSEIPIIDITGVPTVDTLVAQHLLT